MRDPRHLDQLWQELRAAIVVSWRVSTPEIKDEIKRAKEALLQAMEDEKRTM